ncbi:PQQ-dependent sugar dehydrogenase [Sphingomonas sp. PL-96]|uniref:PQQ-dependent sugar dehydrogenase n=1 Tax=Sphingomonas sp. PL-96 TaxID=2887201 RepID=UPI001E324DCC|nr:PQQ-dependent sugar dehydrogenase [Sphingomonas sp. PL-96]MCC2976451.1 PQQ-dependent sugar dehydrogenase [Sphingomonas sp. PL-96]
MTAARMLLLLACTSAGVHAQETEPGTGRNPALPPLHATRTAWLTPDIVPFAAGTGPVAPAGFRVTRFAEAFKTVRNILPLSNGDVLVAQAGADPRGGAVAGRGGDAVYLLRDQDGDGVAELRSQLIGGLRAPYGMALVGGRLFVAENDRLISVPFTPGMTRMAEGTSPKVHARLPTVKGELHPTRNLLASPDGKHLYIGIGAASDAGQRGMAIERHRANILDLDLRSGRLTVFAAGLRNPVGMDFAPGTGALWTVVNERNGLGDDLVPDYLTSVRQGQHFGWPFAYFGEHQDARYVSKPPIPLTRVAKPDFALGGHVAALGLAFVRDDRLSGRYRGGAFVARHGSVERSQFSGYDVVFVPFRNGQAVGPMEPFLTGFRGEGKTVYGRPRSLSIASDGSLLVADDGADAIWRVARDTGS